MKMFIEKLFIVVIYFYWCAICRMFSSKAASGTVTHETVTLTVV